MYFLYIIVESVISNRRLPDDQGALRDKLARITANVAAGSAVFCQNAANNDTGEAQRLRQEAARLRAHAEKEKALQKKEYQRAAAVVLDSGVLDPKDGAGKKTAVERANDSTSADSLSLR